MNKPILWTGTILALLNILIGLILTGFETFNIVITTLIIVATTLLLLFVNGGSEIKDGFKIGLDYIIPILAAAEYLLGLFMPQRFENNVCLIILLILVAIEVLLILISKTTSNQIK